MVAPRVLIVDDDRDSARTLAMLLSVATGAATQIVTDARLAIDAFVEFQPHVAILDLDMPRADGFELCRSIRALPSADAVTDRERIRPSSDSRQGESDQGRIQLLLREAGGTGTDGRLGEAR